MPSNQTNHPSACPCCNPALTLLGEAFLLPRRLFLLGAGSFAATVALGEMAQAKNPDPLAQTPTLADVIYLNGTIVTVNDQQPGAEAVAVKGGKIIAVGDRRTVEKLRSNATQIFDLGGKTMVPGFFDPHGHVFQQGLATLVADLLPPPNGRVDSMAELQEALRQWGNTPTAKELGWIIGNGYDDSLLQEQRHPNREDLDAVSTTVPVMIIHQSGHLGVLNSKGLEQLGITPATPNPPGGVIRRQSGSQEPDGVMEENAFYLGLSQFTKTVKINPNAPLNMIRKGVETYARYGFTTAQEGRATKGVYEAIKTAAAKESLPIDIAVYVDYVAHPDLHTWDIISSPVD